MSDPTPEVSEEERAERYEAMIARDKRLQTIRLAIDIDNEIAKFQTLQYILRKAGEVRDKAIANLINVAAHDQNRIRALQMDAKIVDYIFGWLVELKGEAEAANEQIAYEEGRIEGDEA